MFRGRESPSHMTVWVPSVSALWKDRLVESHNVMSVRHLSIKCSTPVKQIDLREWRYAHVHFWGGEICVCVHNAAIHPATWLSTCWGPAQKQIKSICSCWSDCGFYRMRGVTQQLRGFSDIEPPLRAEDGCLETLPDEQQEIKNSILSSCHVSLSSSGDECDI